MNKQSFIYHLKMFWILFTCYFCFYFTFAVYTNVLNTVVFMVKKGKEKAPPPRLLKLSVFPNPSLLFQPPSLRLLVFDIFSNHPYYSTPRLLETLEYVFKFFSSMISIKSNHASIASPKREGRGGEGVRVMTVPHYYTPHTNSPLR